MPKYMVQASYTADGLKGLLKDKASGRRAAVAKAVEGIGGRVESFYYAFGEHDLVLTLDLPDNATAAALAITVAAAGLARVRTTPLLTIEEADQAVGKSVAYRPPGH